MFDCKVWLLLILLCVPASGQEVQQEAAEFRRLRLLKGHFQGGAALLPEVDSWDGRKHKVMLDLGKALGVKGTSERRLVEVLGEPDEVAQPGSPSWRAVGSSALPGEQLLIYYWRGGHDFLYFATTSKKVLRSGWWMAGE